MEIIFFDIPSNPLPIAVRNSLTNQFFQKNWRFCIFSTTKKLEQVYIGISILVIPDHIDDLTEVLRLRGRCSVAQQRCAALYAVDIKVPQM